MNISIQGKNMSVKDNVKTYIEGKLGKFDKYFNKGVDVRVLLKNEKNRFVAEMTMPLKNGVTFRAEETSNDLYTSIDMVIDKLTRQMRKHKSKIEKRFHKHDSIRVMDIPEYEGTMEEKKIVKNKSFFVKPMDAEEAVLQMEMLNHDFFVFRNSKTEEINVVYIRKDGNYGMIEPEL